MVAPTVPTMVWGGQVRLVARALGVELDDLRETLDRRPLEATVTNAMGTFEAGSQGALRFEVQGIVDGEAVIVVEHVTRIDPACAPDWPQPPEGAEGAHRVVIEGRPAHRGHHRGHRRGRSGGRGATPPPPAGWSTPSRGCGAPPPGTYDASEVPLLPAVGRLGRSTP